MNEREELEQAIERLEAERENLGDVTVDAALAGLYRQLAELDFSGAIAETGQEKIEHPHERRVVTVLFCDVTGSTALAESMDPEAWTGIMNEAFEYLIEPVERFGGTVARLMGDAILAFFGAPTAHEDDPQRAVLAGLAIVEDIKPYREQLSKEKGIDFNVRVGINTGLAVVGDVGAETAGEYTAMGDAVNLAARMEQTAEPGTVQIAQDTFSLVAPLFEYKELGSIPVKGKSEPVLAYQVLGRKAAPTSLRGLTEQGISSPLLGRESEFESAQNAVDTLLAGQGGLLIIQGEAGIGKSRLMSEIHRSITSEASRLSWLEGHSLSYGQTISFLPFQEILRSYAGINEEDDEAETWLKLETAVGELFQDESGEILPYLASLMSIEVSRDYSERVKYLDGEALGRQVYRASRLFFKRLAERRPLLLIFDDLHWMDASSTGLLEHLLPLVDEVPLLICCLSRLDPETPITRLLDISEGQYESKLTRLNLPPLSPSDSRHLIQNLLAIDGLPEQTRQMILGKADGNPFYLEEILRDLIEDGALVQDTRTGRWSATQRIEGVNVPDTIQGLLIGRIDRLDENLKQVVRRAAVIGRHFLYRLLKVILKAERDLEEQLDQLQKMDLIREIQRYPELEYLFKHALAQEAAYESILLEERREVHAQVGEAIEVQMADRLEEFYGLLAYHYSSAEHWDKAQHYLFKAGDQAGSKAADTEALAHYHQALKAYAKVRGEDWDPIERARLERNMGEGFYRLGQLGQARPYLERSLSLLGAELPSSRLGTRLAIARELFIQAVHRILPSLFIRPMGGDLEPIAEEIFETSRALSAVELLANIERLLLLSLRTLNTSERLGYAYGSAVLTANMGTAAVLIGRFGLAQRYFRLSENYAQLTNPSRPVPELDVALAAYSNSLADLAKMREHALQGMEIAQNAGILRQWGIAKITLVYSLWGQAEYGEAILEIKELLQAAEDSSDQQLKTWGLLAAGCVLMRCGLAEDAIAEFERGVKIAEELPDYITLTGLAGWMGRAYLMLGEVELAIDLLENTEQRISDQIGNIPGSAYLDIGLVAAYRTMADETNDQERLSWLKKTRPVLQRVLKEAKRNRLVLSDARLFQGRYEWLHGEQEKATQWWARALAQAESSGQRYEQGVILLEVGRKLNDRDPLLKAESILEEIGAEFDLAKTRDALKNLGKFN